MARFCAFALFLILAFPCSRLGLFGYLIFLALTLAPLPHSINLIRLLSVHGVATSSLCANHEVDNGERIILGLNRTTFDHMTDTIEQFAYNNYYWRRLEWCDLGHMERDLDEPRFLQAALRKYPTWDLHQLIQYRYLASLSGERLHINIYNESMRTCG
jgi:hypothetical protein